MKVILAEKPSVAKDIARVLGVKTKKDGYMEGNGYQVTWAFGHLISLADPGVYGYEKWLKEDLPMLPSFFIYKPTEDEGAKKQLETIERLFNEADSLICATDAGREGEAIFRYIYNDSKCNKPFERLWISSMTDEAILEGFANLKPGTEYDNLYFSARSRNEADWLVGMNATRALTLASRSKKALSLGRVQTPTLALICKRWKEHTDFNPEPFYTVETQLFAENQSFVARYPERFMQKEKAEALAELITPTVTVVDKQIKQKQEKAPLPFDLTSLQAEANRRFNLGAQQTLDIVQALYERHKMLTYPRTGSRYLGDDMLAEVQKKLGALKENDFGKSYLTAIEILEKGKLNKACFDSKQLTDHHAIIPTFQNMKSYSTLTKEEKNIYEMVCKQLVMALLPVCKKEVLSYKFHFSDDKELLEASGTKIKEAGWRMVLDKDVPAAEDAEAEDEQALPNLKLQDIVDVQEKRIKEGMTKKPALMTEATLLKAMETAGRQLDDPEAVQAMKDCGLGTPATRANIIETLYKRNYIVKEKNKLIPTELGYQVYELTKELPIGNPSLTGEWEKKLNLMAKGEYESDIFYNEILAFTKEETAQILSTGEQVQTQVLDGVRCPVCGERLKELPKGWGCVGFKTTGCKFVLWKEMAGKTLTEKHLRQMIEKGKSEVIKGFKSKKGTDFDARVKYSAEEGRVVFDFTPEEIGECPICGKDIIEGKRGFGCSGYKEGCKFVLWKEKSGKIITLSQAQRLLKGETIALKGFTAEDGTNFDSKIKLVPTEDPANPYKVDFVKTEKKTKKKSE